MPDGTDVMDDRRATAVTGFAESLRALRETAGNPSFREMAGRSRAISHTTLHEAARGHRLPSWPTVVEFVKACDGDPARFRGPWEDADHALRTSPTTGPNPDREHCATTVAPVTAPVAGTVGATDDLAESAPDDLPHRRRWYVLAGIAAVIAVGAAVVAFVAGSGSDDHADRAGQRLAAGSGENECPRLQRNPPPAPPRHAGDHGRFITDVTYPDCSHVRRGATFLKVWRFKNAGTVPWRGYSLHRVDTPGRGATCQTITDVPMGTTQPGGMVDVRTEVTAPRTAGFCYARFRIVDANGDDAFPAGRSITFQVYVD